MEEPKEKEEEKEEKEKEDNNNKKSKNACSVHTFQTATSIISNQTRSLLPSNRGSQNAQRGSAPFSINCGMKNT